MANFSIYIPNRLKNKLDKAVKESKKSKNKVITEAVEQWLNRRDNG